MTKTATFSLLAGLVVVVAFAAAFAGFRLWRQGTVVAEAEFDPGIAPFKLTVRRVPVPVTGSDHFIAELKRGEYVVTSFRYFWPDYTPKEVEISWPCIERFTITFDQSYVATCEWKWGAGATWSMTAPPSAKHQVGLSAYYFTPRKTPPAQCEPLDPGLN